MDEMVNAREQYIVYGAGAGSAVLYKVKICMVIMKTENNLL